MHALAYPANLFDQFALSIMLPLTSKSSFAPHFVTTWISLKLNNYPFSARMLWWKKMSKTRTSHVAKKQSLLFEFNSSTVIYCRHHNALSSSSYYSHIFHAILVVLYLPTLFLENAKSVISPSGKRAFPRPVNQPGFAKCIFLGNT